MPEATPTWHIIGQQPTRRLSAAGVVEDGVNVTFVTSDNVTDTLFIPAKGYTLDAVRKIVADRAAEHYAIRRLTG